MTNYKIDKDEIWQKVCNNDQNQWLNKTEINNKQSKKWQSDTENDAIMPQKCYNTRKYYNKPPVISHKIDDQKSQNLKIMFNKPLMIL